MPKMTITKTDGQVIEISDLSLDQIKELAGLNGHAGNGNFARSKKKETSALSGFTPTQRVNDYAGFKKQLTDKARKFFKVLRDNSSGITSDHLAEQVGFSGGSQIGGMVGGGLSKLARKCGVDLTALYRHEATFSKEQGRVVMYYPGPSINSVL
jgi:hypothetical protein